MPEEQRAELMGELTQHVKELAAAREEMCETPEQAMEVALRRPGDPVEIGKKLRREWRRTTGQAGEHAQEWKPEYCVQIFTG
jgi:hypothetical protein